MQTMRKSLIVSIVLIMSIFIATVGSQTKPLYVLPQRLPLPVHDTNQMNFLSGSDKGLYRIIKNKTVEPLWTEGKILQILNVPLGKDDSAWYFVTNNGILYSHDLKTFEYRNSGLPLLTVKKYDGVNTSFVKQVASLKDISVDPLDSNILVTATRDNVYLTTDGGLNWKNMGSMSKNASGIKAVAVSHMPRPSFKVNPELSKEQNRQNELKNTDVVIFQSHAMYGLSYRYVNGNSWNDVSAGFEGMKSISMPDELSDILPAVTEKDDGTFSVDIYIGRTYSPQIYRFDWTFKRAYTVYKGKEPLDTVDSLAWTGNSLVYLMPGMIQHYDPVNKQTLLVPPEYAVWRTALTVTPGNINAAYIPAEKSGFSRALSLNELWLLTPRKIHSAGIKEENKVIEDRRCIYVPEWQAYTLAGMNKFKNIIKTNKLNGLVIDMKDDYGLLRYNSKNEKILQKAKISSYAIDVEQFVREFKKDNIYLIARIVVFKDKNLADYGKKQYSIWNNSTNTPWIGIKGVSSIKDENGVVTGSKTEYYDERWVDPYSPEVWEYNIDIAKELVSRGFDEVQFDYIRFPTDGTNLSKAVYRWKSEGMDKESALISFLSYARANIDAPIGIDIYGANGWYRTGVRTGQDVELLSEYVDVICPMFYPSHFENSFLNYSPTPDRSYRIYYYGTYRNSVIGRNNIIVRPWVQAFYMNVAFDRNYYDKSYVQREVFGVRDSVNHGYMYWNQSGRYDDLSPDPEDAKYPWSATEASQEFRKPALSSDKEVDFIQQEEYLDDISVFDSVRSYGDKIDASKTSYNTESSSSTKSNSVLSAVQQRWQNLAQTNY